MRRLTLIAHGPTSATRKAAFPADEPLETATQTNLASLAQLRPKSAAALVSPNQAARQTADGLGLAASDAPNLADLDHGRWSGRTLTEIAEAEPENLQLWLSDPNFDGHGGESRAVLGDRVARWLEREAKGRGPLIAVTHAAVIRAAILVVLGAGHEAFWRLDIAPLTVTELRHDGRRWALRSSGCPMRLLQ